MTDALPSTPLADLPPLSLGQRIFKRALDLIVALAGLLLLGWLIAAIYAVARATSGQGGFFLQTRVGKNGRLFRAWKFRTMRSVDGFESSVTTVDDPRITSLGRFLRNSKLDELPQLVNILLGDMTLVGPRPDVPGFADQLAGADRILLAVRPGITGPATLAFRHEEELLAQYTDFEQFNRDVIYPAKVRINREYLENYSITRDLKCLLETALVMLRLGGPAMITAQDLTSDSFLSGTGSQVTQAA